MYLNLGVWLVMKSLSNADIGDVKISSMFQ